MSSVFKSLVCTFSFCLICVFNVFAQTEIVRSTEKIIINDQKYYIHTVEKGQTVYSISKAYGVKESDILNSNPSLIAYSLKASETIKIPIFEELIDGGKYIVYTVKPGDTFFSLCKRYGVSENEALLDNPRLKNKKIKIGDKIKFPISSIEVKNNIINKDTVNYYYHLVKKGETLYSITKRYNVSKEELVELNDNIDGINVKVGDLLKIKKNTLIVLDDKSIFLDSIAKSLDYTIENEVNDTKDTLNWYSYGKEFEIVILLPFQVNANMLSLQSQEKSKRPQRLVSSTKMMISFYAGCLMGLDNFISKDVKINLKVYDIGKDNAVLSNLINDGKFVNSDIIFGPAYRSQVEFLNKKINNDKVVTILPFVNNRAIPKKYRRNILLQSSEEFVVSALVKMAEKNPNNNYIIINPTEEEGKQLANLYKDSLLRVVSNNNIHTLNFSGVSLGTNLPQVVKKDVENIFIMPFSNETACTGVFRELFTLKDYEITLFGEASMINYLSIDPEYYSRIKFTFPKTNKINYEDPITDKFVHEYRKEFLCEPDEYSFMGYDAISYFVGNLLKYGYNYKNVVVSEEEYIGMSGPLRFVEKPDFAKSSFSNSLVYIYTLQEDYSFKQVFPIPKEELE